MLGLWFLSLQQRAAALCRAREVALQANLRDLAGRFAALDTLPVVLLRSLQMDPRRLPELQARARPFASLERNQPVWAVEMARARLDLADNGLVLLRPLPPGYEQRPLADGLPREYLAYCLRLPDDQWMVFNFDLEYLYHDWLSEHLQRFGLTGLAWKLVDDGGTPTLLADVSPGFPRQLMVQLDDGPILQENLRLHLAGLALAGLVLTGFAASLRLAAGGLAREHEFSEARGRFMDGLA